MKVEYRPGLWLRAVMPGNERAAAFGQGKELGELKARVSDAHKEWQAAEAYFDSVSEPALVDYAIYCLEAARRKYLYLFRQLRESQGCSDQSEAWPWS